MPISLTWIKTVSTKIKLSLFPTYTVKPSQTHFSLNWFQGFDAFRDRRYPGWTAVQMYMFFAPQRSHFDAWTEQDINIYKTYKPTFNNLIRASMIGFMNDAKGAYEQILGNYLEKPDELQNIQLSMDCTNWVDRGHARINLCCVKLNQKNINEFYQYKASFATLLIHSMLGGAIHLQQPVVGEAWNLIQSLQGSEIAIPEWINKVAQSSTMPQEDVKLCRRLLGEYASFLNLQFLTGQHYLIGARSVVCLADVQEFEFGKMKGFAMLMVTQRAHPLRGGALWSCFTHDDFPDYLFLQSSHFGEHPIPIIDYLNDRLAGGLFHNMLHQATDIWTSLDFINEDLNVPISQIISRHKNAVDNKTSTRGFIYQSVDKTFGQFVSWFSEKLNDAPLQMIEYTKMSKSINDVLELMLNEQ